MASNVYRLATAPLLLALAACQSESRNDAVGNGPPAASPSAAADVPSPRVAPALKADGSFDTEAFLAENDRIIEENKRISREIATHEREDPEKFRRLKAGCERTYGIASDAASAKRIFGCVQKLWTSPI